MSEVAARILPALCQLTVDPDKAVRDHAFRTVKGFLGKLEKLSENPTLRESMGKLFSQTLSGLFSGTFDYWLKFGIF